MSVTLARKLRYGLESGLVRRWHTQPVLHQQSVGEHVYNAQLILLEIWPAAPRELFIALLLHDTAEREVGDIPSPTKRKGGIRTAMDAYEDEVMKDLGYRIPDLGAFEAWVLKLIDGLEGLAFLDLETRKGNRALEECFWNYTRYVGDHLKSRLGDGINTESQAVVVQRGLDIHGHYTRTYSDNYPKITRQYFRSREAGDGGE